MKARLLFILPSALCIRPCHVTGYWLLHHFFNGKSAGGALECEADENPGTDKLARRLATLAPRTVAGGRQRNPAVHTRNDVARGRPHGRESGRGRVGRRTPLRLRHAARPPRLGRWTSGLRAQNPDGPSGTTADG